MAGLSLQELYALNSILCGDHNQTLEQVSKEFRRTFLQPGKHSDKCVGNDKLRLGLAICALLGHSDLLPSAAHRIVAVFLLCVELNPVEKSLCNGITSARAELMSYLESNPFTALALDLLDSPERPLKGPSAGASAPDGRAAETRPGQRDGDGKRVWECPQFDMPPSGELQHKQVAVLRREVAARQPDTRPPLGSIPDTSSSGACNVRCALPSLINVPHAAALKHPQYTEQKATLNTEEALLVSPPCNCLGGAHGAGDPLSAPTAPLALHPSTSAFRPKTIIPPPPLVPLGAGELVGLDWERADFEGVGPLFYVPDEAEMNESLKQSGAAGNNLQAGAVMQRALATQLQLAESNFLIEKLRAPEGLELLQSVSMSPSRLPKLVEDNPMVAVEVLLRLLPSPHITEYFAALINMELSVHGMEVVNRLCSQVDIPEEFLHVYVTQCIQACESMREQPFTQNRLVRMVCVFLSSLIRNRLIRVRDLHVELQAFCIGFNSVREAAALYQTIQTLNQEKRTNE